LNSEEECYEFPTSEDLTGEAAEVSTVGVHETLHFLTTAVEKLTTRFKAVAPLEIVRNEFSVVYDRLARLEEEASVRVPIQSLAPEPYDLMKPIEVVVQSIDDEYTASFFDANLSTGGDTQAEAVSNLRDLIVGTFELLNDTDDSELGPGPGRQKAVLREFIRVR